MIRLYHGTTEQNLVPQYGKGNANSDFGRGFYCTNDRDKALNWACRKNSEGFAHEYLLDESGLNILDLTSNNYSTMEYLALLLKNRYLSIKNREIQDSVESVISRFTPELTDVDIIISRRADDSYFMFAKDFLSGVIPYSYLKRAMALGSLGNQEVIISKNAFDRLHYVKTYTEDFKQHYRQYITDDTVARNKYSQLRNTRWDKSKETTLSQILEEGWEKNDSRLY